MKNNQSSNFLPLLSKTPLGFSLIEVLVGATILSLISLGILQITEQSIDAQKKIAVEDKYYIEMQMGLEIIKSDLYKLYSPLYFSISLADKKKSIKKQNVDEGDDEFSESNEDYYKSHRNYLGSSEDLYPIPKFDQPDKSTFIFLSSNNKRKYRNSKQSRFYWVKYSLSDNKEENALEGTYNLTKQVIKENIYKNKYLDWDNAKKYILLKNIKSITFSFWDEKSEKFVELSSVKKDNMIIRGIKLDITWIDELGFENNDSHIYKPWWPYFEKEKEKNPQEKQNA